MAVAPLALNIFGAGSRLWLSKYQSPNWTTQALVADNNSDPTILPSAFSAGALSSAQSSNLGIVIWLDDRTSVRFYGDGTISPIDIPPPAHYRYKWPYLGNSLTGAFTKTLGAFYHSSAYWMFVIKESIFADLGVTTRQWVCLRSADAGTTWAEQDTANSPFLYDDATSAAVAGGTCQNVYWDGASNKFYIFCSVLGTVDVDRTYGQAFTFDTSLNGGLGGWAAVTDQFLADRTSGTPSTTRLIGSDFNVEAGGDFAGYVFPLSNGDLLAIYSTGAGAGSSNGIYARIASAGVWGAPSLVRNSPSLLALSVFNPGTDTAYVFEYFNGVVGTQPAPPAAFTGGVKVFSVDSSGVATSTLFTFPDPIGGPLGGPNGYTDGMDRGLIIDGFMYVLYDDWNDDSNAVWAWDMSGGVNFSKLNLLPHPSAEPPSGPTGTNPPSCGMLFFGEITPAQTLTLNKVVSGGSSVASDWTLSAAGPTPISGPGPTVGPTAVDTGDYTLSESGPSGYDASDWVISGGTPTGPNTVTIGPGDTVVATITNTVQTPAPACPVDGGSGRVGIPYSATVTATGGTPPYTFTIVGGSLPPGLTLDSSTGVISGTPTTSGTYSYTIQVTGS